MKELLVAKGKGYSLVPHDPAAEEYIRGLKAGEGVWIKVKKCRNPKFHRKFFALLNLGYDAWVPSPEGMEYRGMQIQKNFDRFRKDMVILSGHYELVFGADGAPRKEAKSISFSNMDELEFNDLYKDVFNVLWDRVLSLAGFRSCEEVENIVNQMLAFE